MLTKLILAMKTTLVATIVNVIQFKPGPAEEHYDLINDPYEVNNVASAAIYLSALIEHRKAMNDPRRI